MSTRLPDINEVRPVSAADDAVFAEIREVLERHGALQRFGVTLLHQHFDIADSEVLLETIDVENRILTSKPASRTDGRSSIETSWRLDAPNGARECETQCSTARGMDGDQYHQSTHYTVS
ncbi:hypothetical protein [Nakamurella multipartita]|uniref:Uncharacterized protein n=1 Tax=Nakamurella multipartita (strain ATCC 700099 / DSM 44233 / CIP 104796 / JCM 9543 / NBRC 105858 / Y-104) TaxID=479431 RepID=C8XI92_NAKMY|nr:hypothetical protein [Nakamurella multipartita]ACV78461.1 hypothetical protein Namu_2083 [Nakamurella multipartita DSM 44233]